MKIIKALFILALTLVFLYGGDVYVLSDRHIDKIEKKFLKNIYNDSKKKGYNIYYYNKDGLNSNLRFFQIITKIKSIHIEKNDRSLIFKFLYDLVQSRRFEQDDKIVIFSNMLYKKTGIVHDSEGRSVSISIDFMNMSPEDGFITSDRSPFSSFFSNQKKNVGLHGTKIYIITSNKPFRTLIYPRYKFYQYNLQRFYHYFFKKLNGKLMFFGRHNCGIYSTKFKCNRLKNIFVMDNPPNIKYTPLRDVEIPKYIDINMSVEKAILYDLSNF